MGKYEEQKDCPKCENSGVTTSYDDILDEMIRICRRCEYKWVEDPLDKVPAESNDEILKKIHDEEAERAKQK